MVYLSLAIAARNDGATYDGARYGDMGLTSSPAPARMPQHPHCEGRHVSRRCRPLTHRCLNVPSEGLRAVSSLNALSTLNLSGCNQPRGDVLRSCAARHEAVAPSCGRSTHRGRGTRATAGGRLQRRRRAGWWPSVRSYPRGCPGVPSPERERDGEGDPVGDTVRETGGEGGGDRHREGGGHLQTVCQPHGRAHVKAACRCRCRALGRSCGRRAAHAGRAGSGERGGGGTRRRGQVVRPRRHRRRNGRGRVGVEVGVETAGAGGRAGRLLVVRLRAATLGARRAAHCGCDRFGVGLGGGGT
jgi:hypothetical protein